MEVGREMPEKKSRFYIWNGLPPYIPPRFCKNKAITFMLRILWRGSKHIWLLCTGRKPEIFITDWYYIMVWKSSGADRLGGKVSRRSESAWSGLYILIIVTITVRLWQPVEKDSICFSLLSTACVNLLECIVECIEKKLIRKKLNSWQLFPKINWTRRNNFPKNTKYIYFFKGFYNSYIINFEPKMVDKKSLLQKKNINI